MHERVRAKTQKKVLCKNSNFKSKSFVFDKSLLFIQHFIKKRFMFFLEKNNEFKTVTTRIKFRFRIF